MIGPSGLFNNLPPICNPRFNFIGASENNQLIKLGCEKYFLQGHILDMLLPMSISIGLLSQTKDLNPQISLL
jgi:hypothetical protein